MGTTWKAFEKFHVQALANVHNFNVQQLAALLKDAKVKLYNYTDKFLIIEYCNKNDIIIEAYSPLMYFSAAPPLSSVHLSLISNLSL
ncbi:hypothetical protein K439DRAFT_1639733 [Ramaria rubella]|nr:hypothetical protein K439DRAFT_1639733 [Ramaria rubella]